jgi:hypothetical protein
MPLCVRVNTLANDPAEGETVRALRAELEASRQSRLRAWYVLQEIRKILTSLGNRQIAVPKERNEATTSLAAVARRVDKAATVVPSNQSVDV